jgi:hypothetical protein
MSTFPYDYKLVPAETEAEFVQISGQDLLDRNPGQLDLAQVKRLEMPLSLVPNSPSLQGVWRSGQRAHEQIWRSLASSPDPVMLSISLRCTVLYEKEREKLLRFEEKISALRDQPLNQQTLSGMQHWNRKQMERCLAPWTRFFYLQVHVVSTCKLNGNLLRTIGAALTSDSSGDSLPGYQILSPEQAQVWQNRLKDLDTIFTESYLPVRRLSEVADLEEVFAVFRLPYSPPENGFPDVNFIRPENGQGNQQAPNTPLEG